MSTSVNTETTASDDPGPDAPSSAGTHHRTATKDADAGWVRGVFRGVQLALTVVFVAVIAMGFIVPRLLGAVPMAVLTGSMEPTYSPGDLVISQPVAAEDIRVGDVVTFQPESNHPALVTHRVTGKSLGADGLVFFTTQGDANGAPDDPIVPEQIKGKIIYSLPYLGYISTMLGPQTKAAGAAVIGVALLGYAGFAVLGAVRSRSRKTTEGGTE